MRAREIDVVGLGLNATDTVLTVQSFPPLGGKEKAIGIFRHAGGQVATAIVTCQRLGMKTRYVGKVGDDEGGRLQMESLRREGVDTSYVLAVPKTSSQLGLIIVDQSTGERTVFWHRDPRLAVMPAELKPEAFRRARILLIDGCDVDACLAAARWAKEGGIPVVADYDTVYTAIEKLFPVTDYLIASHNFLPAVTGVGDSLQALNRFARDYPGQVLCMTLGRDGAAAIERGELHYSPGFAVATVDTTGAGDVFHGAFIHGILKGWPITRTLEFSNAMAALNCTKLGARGGIATVAEAEKLMASGQRHRHDQYDLRAEGPVQSRASRGRKASGRSR